MNKRPITTTKYAVSYTSVMKKDMKRAQKRGYNTAEIAKVISKLANDEPLEERYRDLPLTETGPGTENSTSDQTGF